MTTKAAIRLQYQVMLALALSVTAFGGGVLIMILTGHSDGNASVVAVVTSAAAVVSLSLWIALRRIKRAQFNNEVIEDLR